MYSRGYPSVSSRTSLGQRALELPTILVTNQHSLSDAEDFTEGYRTLKLGKVVGEPTAGWIIYTGGITLIDGSVLRMPATKIFAADGTPMEMHPRPVDIPVTRPAGDPEGISKSPHARLSIVRSAMANSRKPTAPRQYPTGSSRNVWCAKATTVPTVNASAASPISSQQSVRMRAIIRAAT